MKAKIESYKSGAIYSAGLSVVVKFIAFFQNFLIAYYLGAGTGTDIYFYMFGGMIAACEILQSITSSILIPRSMLLRNQDSFHTENAYLNAFLYTILSIAIIIIGIILINGKECLLLLSNFSAQDIDIHLPLLYILLPASIPYIINVVYVEVLASYKYFIFPQIITVINNIFIILFIVLFHASLGVFSLAVGFGIATIINFLWLVIFIKRNLSWSYSCFSFTHLKDSFSDICVKLVNDSTMAFTTMFPMYLLSMFYPGTITVITYANKLLQAPMILLVQLFAVLQIKLSELYSKHLGREMKRTYIEIGGKSILLSLIGAIFFFILRRPIVEICFGNGAMTPENIEVFIEVLGILIISIPFSIITAVSTRMLFVMRKIKTYTLLMIPCSIITCVLYYWLIEQKGVNGYAVADVSMEVVKSVMLLGCTLLLLRKIKCKYEN